ncbi:MAG: PH domain-containing protein [Phycisphaerales bacterium]
MSSKPSVATRAAQRTYRGVWAVLRRWFRVPEEPPNLPVHGGGHVEAMRPAEGYLRYLTFQFWVFLVLFDVALITAWIVTLVAMPVVGIVIAVPIWLIAIVPDVFAYVAIHLRYDTTWYVLSDRSMRLRRGIWIINEATITYENVQNVTVTQGPLQRWFGIADVVVQTAGGGVSAGPHGPVSSGGHRGTLEGIADAAALRDRIMDRVRASRSAGLGDERHEDHRASAGGEHRSAWSAQHVATLREIRDEVIALRRGP